MQKRLLLLTLLVALFFNIATAQKTHNVFWIMPTKAKKVNGVCFTFFTPEIFENYHRNVSINGINVTADVVNIMVAFMSLTHIALGDTAARKNLLYDYLVYKEDTFRINGINIGTGSIIDQSVNGVNIDGIYTFANSINGVSVTPLLSKLFKYNGLLIGGLYNKTTIGKGVQIGLINDCKDCQGVQIGLINKIGKRVTPFINFRFKKRLKS